jgi:hypothetical protein
MNMHRTLAFAATISAAALLLPAGISSTAGSATSSSARIALLDRPAGPDDQLPPAVAKAVNAKEVDVSTVRLGATSGSSRFYVAQGTRGVCLIRVDDPVAPAFSTTCASTLISGGVYLASLDRTAGTMQVADVVPDDVTSATVDGTPVPVSGNLLVTGDVRIGASVSVVSKSSGTQPVLVTPAATSELPAVSG